MNQSFTEGSTEKERSFRPIPGTVLRHGLLWGLALLASTAVEAQIRTNALSAHSRSGQFVVRFEPGRTSKLNVTNNTFIRLEPTLLTISCERIKSVLLRELENPDTWQGKVFIWLYPARVANSEIGIACRRFSDGWQYHLEMPDIVEQGSYVRAITEVLLLEMANRGAVERSAEVPTWLLAGLAEEFLASNELQIILQPPKNLANGLPVTWTYVDAVRENPLQRVHRTLGEQSPLTFEQLSWPSREDLSRESGAVYRASAQLLVHQLANSEGGRGRLRAFLGQLPRHYNWQFAFLKAFQFARPLDIEKWWALQVAYFMGRDPMSTWTREESWEKLEASLLSAVQVHTATNDLPVRSSATFQTIIGEWEGGLQVQTLQSKLRELEALRLRLSPNLVPLVDAYRVVLDGYLQQRMKLNFAKPNRVRSAARRLSQDAIKQLDLLDARREAMRVLDQPKPSAPLTLGAGRSRS